MVSFSARRISRSRQRDAWDALADIEVFIFATEAELEAMEAERVISCRKSVAHSSSWMSADPRSANSE